LVSRDLDSTHSLPARDPQRRLLLVDTTVRVDHLQGATLAPNLSRIHHEFGSTLGEVPATLDRGRQASSVNEIT
jgi:hypothetical protein